MTDTSSDKGANLRRENLTIKQNSHYTATTESATLWHNRSEKLNEDLSIFWLGLRKADVSD